MTQHTPGPWEAVKSNRNQFAWDVIGALGMVPTIARLGLVDPHEEAVKANARLIAAAPELLEALKLAADQLDEVVDMNNPANWLDNSKATLEFLHQAIAKAEGRG